MAQVPSVTDDAFESEVLQAAEPTLVDFWADWCGPCRSMDPTIRRLVADGYPVRKIDIDQQRQLASQYGVTAVPCFVMLANGRVVDRVEGVSSYDRLVQMLNKARVAPVGREKSGMRRNRPMTGPAGRIWRTRGCRR